jgi:hypothetical protein
MRARWIAVLVALAGCGNDDGAAADAAGDRVPDAAAGVADAAPSPDGPPLACGDPLDDETLGLLTISIEPTLAMRPGQSAALRLGVVECCYFFTEVDACATWSISPDDGGARIGATTGELAIDEDTPAGAVYTVTADVEDGRRQVDIEVHVWTPEANPLHGIWREVGQHSCEDGVEIAPADPINELRFIADGRINVTWHPFELYVDWWGDYAFDLGAGTLDLTVIGGNYVPEDIDADGSFEIDESGRLILRDMWLGTPQGELAAVRCGHVFER